MGQANSNKWGTQQMGNHLTDTKKTRAQRKADTKKRTHVTGVTAGRNKEVSAKHRCVAFSRWHEATGTVGKP